MDIAHEIAVEVWNNYIARPNNDPEKHRFSFKDLEKAINLHQQLYLKWIIQMT